MFVDYKIVEGAGTAGLTSSVEGAISEGYQPFGSPFAKPVDYNILMQAVVKGTPWQSGEAGGYSTPQMYGVPPGDAVIGNNLDAMFAAGGDIRFEVPGTYITDRTWVLVSGTRLYIGPGVTIKLADGANCNIFQNYAYNASSATLDESLEISGCGAIDFNGTNQNTAGLSSMASILKGITNLKIGGGIKVVNANKYSWLVCNIENLTAEGLNFDTFSDGLHCQPPIKNAYIRNLKGKTGDDMLAFTIGDYANYNISEAGDFSNIDVAGLFCESALCAVKITGNTTGIFDNFRIAGVFGNTNHAVFRIWGDTNLLSTVVNSLTVEDIHATPGAGYPVVDIDDRNFAAGQYGIEIDSAVFRNIYSAKADEQTVRISSTVGTMIHNLLIDTPPRDAMTVVGLNHTSTTIENLTICNGDTNFIDNANSSVLLNRGTIKRLVVDNYRAIFPSTSNGGIARLIGACTVNEACFTDVHMEKGVAGWNNVNSAMASPTSLNLVNYTCDGGLRVAQVLSSVLNVKMKNVSVINGKSANKPFYAKGGMITLSGDIDCPYNTIVSDNGGSITTTAGVHNIPCDVSLLASTDGAAVQNLNSALSCGAGMVIVSAKVWKNVYSGSTYTSSI